MQVVFIVLVAPVRGHPFVRPGSGPYRFGLVWTTRTRTYAWVSFLLLVCYAMGFYGQATVLKNGLVSIACEGGLARASVVVRTNVMM